jgi:hypothetical protein
MCAFSKTTSYKYITKFNYIIWGWFELNIFK